MYPFAGNIAKNLQTLMFPDNIINMFQILFSPHFCKKRCKNVKKRKNRHRPYMIALDFFANLRCKGRKQSEA